MTKKNVLLPISVVFLITAASSYVSSRPVVFNTNMMEIQFAHSNEQYYKNLFLQLEKKLTAKINKKAWRVNLKKVRGLLEEESWVSSYSIQKYIPNQIDIVLKPREIVAVYVDKNGTTLPVSDSGTILPKGKLTSTPVAPIINQKKIIEKDKVLDNLIKILSHIPKNGNFSTETIEQISLDEKQNIWFHIDKMKIKLNEKDTKKKVSRVNRTIKYLKTRDIINCVIDADLSQKVLVRLNVHN